jgi:hypothetical protein
VLSPARLRVAHAVVQPKTANVWSRTAFLFCLSLLAAAFLPSSAAAQAASDPPSQQANDPYHRLVGEALTAYEQGRFVTALSLFEQAYALRPNARAMRGIALVLFELGDHVKTLRALDRALDCPIDPLPEDLRQQLMRVRTRVAALLERVAVRLEPRGAMLLIDGHEAELNQEGELWLEPGVHRVEARISGFQPEVRALEAVAGGAQTLWITLVPLHTPVPAETAQRPGSSLGWGIATAVGLVTTGLTVWQSAALSRTFSRCETAEGRGAVCVNEAKIRRLRAASIAGALAFAGLTIGSAFPFVRSLKRSKEQPTKLGFLSCSASRSGAYCKGSIAW